MSKIDIASEEIKDKKHLQGGVGTHLSTSGPCYGYPKGGDPKDKKWFPTRTKLKKAGYTYLESAYSGKKDE